MLSLRKPNRQLTIFVAMVAGNASERGVGPGGKAGSPVWRCSIT